MGATLFAAMLSLLLPGHHETVAAARFLNSTSAELAHLQWESHLAIEGHALLIGIDNYDHPGWPQLSEAQKDVRALSVALKRHNFAVQTPAANDSRSIKDAIEDFFLKYGELPDSRLFFWFAGHGYTTTNGEGYLVPSDAPPENLDRIGFLKRAISMRLFDRLLRETRARRVFIVLDACYAGTIFSKDESVLTSQTGTPLQSSGSQAFLAAGTGRQTVLDNGRFQNIFVKTLLGEQPEANLNGDNFITVVEISLHVEKQIAISTRGGQTPIHGAFRGNRRREGDFVFKIPEPEVQLGPFVLQNNKDGMGGVVIRKIITVTETAEFSFEVGHEVNEGDVIKLVGSESMVATVASIRKNLARLKSDAEAAGRMEFLVVHSGASNLMRRGSSGARSISFKLPEHPVASLSRP